MLPKIRYSHVGRMAAGFSFPGDHPSYAFCAVLLQGPLQQADPYFHADPTEIPMEARFPTRKQKTATPPSCVSGVVLLGGPCVSRDTPASMGISTEILIEARFPTWKQKYKQFR